MPTVLTWAFALAGVVLTAVPTFRFLQRTLHARIFLDALAKLASKGDFAKARRVCRSAPHAPVARLAATAFALRLEATVLEPGGETDYRRAPEEVPFEERVRAALEPQAAAAASAALKLALIAALGGASSAASLWPPWPAVPTAFGAMGVVFCLLSLKMHAAIRSGLQLALERLPPLVRPGDEMHADAPTGAQPAGGTLVLSVAGPDGGERSVAFEPGVIKIGRLATAQLVLDHPDVSRMHAVIELGDDQALLIDLGSARGTQLDGRNIDKAHLFTGSVITIGPFRLTVHAAP